MACNLSRSDVNHLRRLVAWVACDIGQSPEEFVETVRKISEKIGEPSDYGKQRLLESYHEARSVPLYIRAAVKALNKTLREHDKDGEITDGEVIRNWIEPAHEK